MHVGVVMTSTSIVEGGVEFLVHVTALLLGIAEGIGLTVNGPAAFDLAMTAEGGDAAGFVVFGGAFGAGLREKSREVLMT